MPNLMKMKHCDRLMLHRFTDWLDNLKGNDELKEKRKPYRMPELWQILLLPNFHSGW